MSTIDWVSVRVTRCKSVVAYVLGLGCHVALPNCLTERRSAGESVGISTALRLRNIQHKANGS